MDGDSCNRKYHIYVQSQCAVTVVCKYLSSCETNKAKTTAEKKLLEIKILLNAYVNAIWKIIFSKCVESEEKKICCCSVNALVLQQLNIFLYMA